MTVVARTIRLTGATLGQREQFAISTRQLPGVLAARADAAGIKVELDLTLVSSAAVESALLGAGASLSLRWRDRWERIWRDYLEEIARERMLGGDSWDRHWRTLYAVCARTDRGTRRDHRRRQWRAYLEQQQPPTTDTEHDG